MHTLSRGWKVLKHLEGKGPKNPTRSTPRKGSEEQIDPKNSDNPLKLKNEKFSHSVWNRPLN